LRVIEQLHQELDEERRVREELEQFREEAISKVAELEQSREEAISLAGQRLRDTARNILRLGLPVEQVAQATGLPPETVQTLASRP
jgi:predicted transposase YdaD